MSKYNSIMNVPNFYKLLARFEPQQRAEILKLEAYATEKLHGENFRCGVDETGKTFIGQRNNIFYKNTDHPHWNKIHPSVQEKIIFIQESLKRGYDESDNPVSFVFYGELIGVGMQDGFKWDFENLQIRWFDAKFNNEYLVPNVGRATLAAFNIPLVPIVKKDTIENLLNLDVESIQSSVSLSPYIEGVVIAPLYIPDWYKMETRLIIKHKTAKYAEAKRKSEPKEKFDSEFSQYVTHGRLVNVLGHLSEQGVELKDEMSDMKHLVPAVVSDIVNEENDGKDLEKPERTAISKAIGKLYTDYLTEKFKNE